MAYDLQPALDVLRFLIAVMGKTDNVTINSGICSHNTYGEDVEGDIITIKGTVEKPIGLEEVSAAFKEMQTQFEMCKDGRSFFYETSGMYEINWGS